MWKHLASQIFQFVGVGFGVAVVVIVDDDIIPVPSFPVAPPCPASPLLLVVPAKTHTHIDSRVKTVFECVRLHL